MYKFHLTPLIAKKLISKVDSIIKKLDAEKVTVQGHTDSVGSTDINKKLSKNRASAVAKYLLSLAGGYKITYVGYGESHPIASNETAQGRKIGDMIKGAPPPFIIGI